MTSTVKSITGFTIVMLITLPWDVLGFAAASDHQSPSVNLNAIPEINESTLNSTIAEHIYFILDCYAPLCRPCETMDAALKELSKDLGDQVALGRINLDENGQMAERYNITYAPTLLTFRKGTLVDMQEGPISGQELLGTIYRLSPDINTSQVDLSAFPEVPRALMQNVPLADLGIDNPGLPMLINESNLDSAIVKYPFFVLEGFAGWCGFCKMMNVTVMELSQDLRGQVAFGLINTDTNSKVTGDYGITTFPTILIFKNGVFRQMVMGYAPASELIKVLDDIDPGLRSSKYNLTPSTARKNRIAVPNVEFNGLNL
jgi:thioredoxin-like negative regulator of GroEL